MRLLLLPLAGMVLLCEGFATYPDHPPLPSRFYKSKYVDSLYTRQQPLDYELYKRPITFVVGLIRLPLFISQMHNTPRSHITDDEDSDLSSDYIPPEVSQNLPPPSTMSNKRRRTSNEQGNQSSSPPGFRFEQDSKPTPSESSVIFPQQPSFTQQHKPQFDQDFKPSVIDPNARPHVPQAVKPQSFGNGRKPSPSDQDQKHPEFELAEEPFAKENNTSPVGTLASHPGRNPACNVRPDPGTCRAAFPRYFLDPETGTCNCFLYGGCREDGLDESPGSFYTLEECQHECHPPSMEEGPVCKEIFDDDQFISFL